MRGTPVAASKIAPVVRLRPGIVLVRRQHPRPGVEQLVHVRAVGDSVFRKPTVAADSFSSSPFQTAGCSAAKRRVAATSLPVPMQ